jgi:LVIVD repeat
MKQPRFLAPTRVLLTTISLGLLAAGTPLVDARADNQQGASSHNMSLVGTNDLQARSTYQPTLHKYSAKRYILFAGHHALALQGEGLLPSAQPLPSFNPLTGKNELNGTSIVDVSDPRHPKYLFHLPVPDGVNGGAQMVRVCDGSTLPIHDNKVYMLRTYANSAHEIWDVTNPSNPVGVRTVAGGNPVIGAQTGTPGALAGTHKSWWECDTGIAYIVGRRGNDTADGWRTGNHIFVFDISNPANPVFLRDWALDGQQPGGVIPPHFTAVPSIHGPISTGPDGGAFELAGATGNRVYFAYGTGSNGVMQVVDRSSLLPPPFGSGVKCGSSSSTLTSPGCTDFHTAELGRLIMNPDNGAHTSWPLGKIIVPDFVTDTGNDNSNTTRDIVVVTSEATAQFCSEFRHLTFMTDVSTEGRPQSVATAEVLASEGRFCDRGGRFGPHATNEEFGPPFYQKIVFISYFNAGVRAFDVRDPYNPQDVASFIPAVTANTDYRCGPYQGNPNVCRRVVQTNNVATDDRGYIYIVDRANTGLHVLRLEGEAKEIVEGKD